MKRKHVKCFGLFLWKSCHVNCRRSQGLMSAPGMIQTPWYSNDHLSNQNLSETSQSLARFFKNNNYFSKFGESCAWKMGKKIENSRYPNTSGRTSWEKETAISWVFGYVEVSGLSCVMTWIGCPLHFWPSERRDGKFVPRCMYTMKTNQQTKKHFRAFPYLFQNTTNDRFLTFLLRSMRTNACSHCGHI